MRMVLSDWGFEAFFEAFKDNFSHGFAAQFLAVLVGKPCSLPSDAVLSCSMQKILSLSLGLTAAATFARCCADSNTALTASCNRWLTQPVPAAKRRRRRAAVCPSQANQATRRSGPNALDKERSNSQRRPSIGITE